MMPRVNPRIRRLVDARKAAKEGKRYHAFYRGCHDGRGGPAANPYPPGSEEATCWDNGRKYAEGEP